MFLGDIHGYNHVWKRAKDLVRHFEVDAMIVCGDFGWWNSDHPGARDFVNDSGVPVYWIDGNHENFDHLYAHFNYDLMEPQETQEDIFWLPRGTVMPLGRYQCMFFGGGTSIDRMRRVEHESWWSQEKITQGEINRAINNWDLRGPPGPHTMLISHETPTTLYDASPALSMNEGKIHNVDSMHDRKLLDELFMNIQPDLHFHGHWHIYHCNKLYYPNFSSDPAVTDRNVRTVGLECDAPSNFWIEDVS